MPLNNPRFEKNFNLGWIVFAVALLYVYVLPIFLSPQVFERVSGVIEGLLIALIALYFYWSRSTTIPWLVLLVLAVGKLYDHPIIGFVMALVSLALALTP